MRKNLKLVMVASLVAFFVFATWLGLTRLAKSYLVFYVIPSNVLPSYGFENWEVKKKRSELFFSMFPSLLCPAVKGFIDSKENKDELKAEILFDLLGLPIKYRNCVESVLEDTLKNNESLNDFAAIALGHMGKDATPSLIEAWNGKGNFNFKSDIAASMIEIKDERVVPVLEESSKMDSDETVYAVMALYEITGEEKYKLQIISVLKSGSRRNRALAITFMAGLSANKNMIPFLEISTRDKDEKLRKLAKNNINSILQKTKTKEKSPN